MTREETRRACRHKVKWPARIRSIAEADWQGAQVVSLSVTGVLLQTFRRYDLGERVEVEIDFLAQPESPTIVAGVGYVVRNEGAADTAVHFDLGCSPKAATGRNERGARP